MDIDHINNESIYSTLESDDHRFQNSLQKIKLTLIAAVESVMIQDRNNFVQINKLRQKLNHQTLKRTSSIYSLRKMFNSVNHNRQFGNESISNESLHQKQKQNQNVSSPSTTLFDRNDSFHIFDRPWPCSPEVTPPQSPLISKPILKRMRVEEDSSQAFIPLKSQKLKRNESSAHLSFYLANTHLQNTNEITNTIIPSNESSNNMTTSNMPKMTNIKKFDDESSMDVTNSCYRHNESSLNFFQSADKLTHLNREETDQSSSTTSDHTVTFHLRDTIIELLGYLDLQTSGKSSSSLSRQERWTYQDFHNLIENIGTTKGAIDALSQSSDVI